MKVIINNESMNILLTQTTLKMGWNEVINVI